MKVVVAMDSFKGSLTSKEAGEAVAEGIRRLDSSATIQVCPMADGGEGTVDALIHAMGGRLQSVQVQGPLESPVLATYGIIEQTQTAVMEMAQAAGLTLIPKEKRNPMVTSTFGVGQMILHGAKQGCNRFLIGIGGSATNDGGAGMLQSLGFKLLDQNHKDIPKGAIGLEHLTYLLADQVPAEIKKSQFLVACDVTNPLCGPEGASLVFGPQKGGTGPVCAQMDQRLHHFGHVATNYFPQADTNAPGAGAAGGMGFAFRTFLGATLQPGVQIVSKETGLEEKIKEADIVITGEGRLDGQTEKGKVPYGVAQLCVKYGKPVYAFAGIVTPDAHQCHQWGVTEYFSTMQEGQSLEEAMRKNVAVENLIQAVEKEFSIVQKNGLVQAQFLTPFP